MGYIKKYSLLLIVLILASVLRFYDLANNPPGLTWDEASLGYNAYSLLQSGKDEYGSLLPLNLRSFGDWKPSLYAYLDIPFVAIFGLNEIAVRLPSGVFGVLGVYGTYLLVYQLFKRREVALFSAFFLAISPWHIQFSRPAFEANVALTFNIFAVYFFIKGITNSKFFLVSSILFGLSLLTYQASRLFVPLIVIFLSIFFWKSVKVNKFTSVSIAILILFLLLIGYTFLSGQSSRLSTQNFFAYQRVPEITEIISKEDSFAPSSIEFKILHGQWFEYVRGLTERYFIYFSPKMLFIDGDYSERHRVPDLGPLYYFSLVTIPLGIWWLLRKGEKEAKWIVFGWLLLAPLPAIFSRDLISILRSLNMIIPWVILEAIGFWWLVGKIREKRGNWGYLGVILISFVIVINLILYLDRYFIHAPKEYSKYWLYGYKLIFSELNKLDLSKYQKVVITDVYGQPYIYYLFYTKYDPEKFQKQIVLDQQSVDVGTVRNIDNIEFKHINWPSERGDKNSLFIGSLEELPNQDIVPFKEFNLIKDINFLNGEHAFRIVEIL